MVLETGNLGHIIFLILVTCRGARKGNVESSFTSSRKAQPLQLCGFIVNHLSTKFPGVCLRVGKRFPGFCTIH